jgi:hypothetical protein
MCCGRPSQPINSGAQRAAQATARPQSSAKTAAQSSTRAVLALPTPVFEYVGATALTLVSPVTRKTYRFEQTGARVEIDVRDRSWVAFVPNVVAVG